MIHTTKAIVLRTTKYGDTSMIVNLFTEVLGVQTYIVNGVRKANKKGSAKANIFTAGNLLQVVAYANEFKNMNRLKEYSFATLYQNIPQSIFRNAILIFCIELIGKCLQEPSPEPEIFALAENTILQIEQAPLDTTYNIPIIFLLKLATELGLTIQGKCDATTPYLNIIEGTFIQEQTDITYTLDEHISIDIYALLQCNLQQTNSISLSNPRKIILEKLLQYLQYHIPNVQYMRSPQILQTLF